MPFDEGLAQRIRELLQRRDDVVEKKMFGGLCFMVSGNMCCGVESDRLMMRVGPDNYETCLQKPHVREMDFTGKALKGFVYVDEPGVTSDADLEEWLLTALEFVTSLPAK